MRRALRMGVVSREIEVVVNGRVRHLAATVSSLGPRRANMGYVLVFDDLTEMLHAQKSAAWQEVARRIAHEIKIPHAHPAFRATPDASPPAPPTAHELPRTRTHPHHPGMRRPSLCVKSHALLSR